jgi:hypothetical protein
LTVEAVQGTTRTLEVISAIPVPVSLSVEDLDGRKNGTTDFSRTYAGGTFLTMSVPPVIPAWLINGLCFCCQVG